VTEISVLAHSMGNWVTLEALRARYIRPARMTDKVKNVMLVARDVDVDVFRTQIHRMGTQRPRFFLFVSQDESARAVTGHLGRRAALGHWIMTPSTSASGTFDTCQRAMLSLIVIGGRDG
jgi:esterase/lipase superfamily enzyme